MNLIASLLTTCFGQLPLLESVQDEATMHTAEGRADLSLELASLERLGDGTQLMVAVGMNQGAEVALRLRLSPGWRQGTFADTGLTTYQSKVSFESVGPASDCFLAVLTRLFGGKHRAARMAPTVSFTAISVAGAPAHLEQGPVQLKLFFMPKEDTEEAYHRCYAEYQLNIDAATGVVEFLEKDPEYREPMLRVLAGGR